MKRILLLVIMAAIMMPAFVSCKKGPDDPTLSFKSRNSRLKNNWKLSKIAGTETMIIGSNTTTTTTTFDGTIFTKTISGTSSSGTGSYELDILDDGVMKFTEDYTPSGGSANVTSGTDVWYWFGNDNTKIAVYIGNGGSTLFKQGIYNIDELKSSELILTQDYVTNDNGNSDTFDIKYTFEKM